MDDSVIDLSSSSKTSKPSANPRFSHDDSRETDENDQMVLKNQNPKRPPMKHFMQPTISAASKAAIPRKKILTERNESLDSSETHHINTLNLVPKAHFQKSSNFSETPPKPYDPLTNYLSPRPRFLRYNPSRHRKIFVQQETEIEKENEGSNDDLSSSSLESSNEIENKEPGITDHDLEADDEELEDFENEGSLSLKGVFKFSLVSIALLLLTWYISCMNSSTTSPTMHLMRESFEEYASFYNHTYDIVGVNTNGVGFFKIFDENPNGINEFFDKPKGTEITQSAKKIESFQDDQNGEYHDLDTEVEGVDHKKGIQVSETEDKSEYFEEFQTSPVSELVDIYVSENEATGKSASMHSNGINEFFDKPKGIEITGSTEKIKSFQDDQNGEYHDLDTEVEGVDHEKEIQISETVDKSESFEEYQIPPVSELENEAKGNSVSMDSKLEAETEIKTSTEISDQGEGNAEENKSDSVEVFIGIFMIIASSILAFRFRHKRTPIVKSQHIEKPLHNPLPAKKVSSEGPSDFNTEKARLGKVDPYADHSAYFPSIDENLNNFSLTRAPTVELLGEFVVGDIRSSMKSCSAKNKTKEMELEAETKSVLVDKANNSRTHLSTSEFPVSTTMASPYAPAKKIVKDEEGSAKTTTPVRRSSRIRNRAMSP